MAATGQAPDSTHAIGADAQFASIAAPIVFPPPASFYARRLKRPLDVVLSVTLLIALMPLIVGVALAVLLTSGWPIFYGSDRIGLDGRRFPMWKFRTMVHDADAVFERWKDTHPDRAAQLLTHWKLEKDPRVTPLGRFLRKYSLDELPQFWNVIVGEMSIVGPRPYLSRESLDPVLAAAITSVRPGLTGPFQVRGRKELAPRDRMEIEASYAPDVRLIKDLVYMARTVQPLIRLDGC